LADTKDGVRKYLGAVLARQEHPGGPAVNREAARVVSSHPEQGWSLLCNGVVLFEDTGELLPDGRIIGPNRPTDIDHRCL
jgi:uncharacterized protein DUF5999